MTDHEARAWIAERYGVEAVERLTVLTDMVTAENTQQNLVSPSTIAMLWSRHVVDSAQLAAMALTQDNWIDIGTGGGFPGLVVALLRPGRMILTEPRKRRAEFLERCVAALAVADVEVIAAKVEALTVPAAVISARAVASVEKLFLAAAGCATVSTRWLLPRGQFGEADLAALRRHWRGEFHVEQSLSDAASSILVAERVSRR